MSQRTTAALLAALISVPVAVVPAIAQNQSVQSEEMLRRAKTKVQPAYPDLARKMNITGTVKIEVTVSPNGSVKDARVVGGHPVLSAAALDAALEGIQKLGAAREGDKTMVDALQAATRAFSKAIAEGASQDDALSVLAEAASAAAVATIPMQALKGRGGVVLSALS